MSENNQPATKGGQLKIKRQVDINSVILALIAMFQVVVVAVINRPLECEILNDHATIGLLKQPD